MPPCTGAGANAPRIFLQSRPDKSKWGHGAYLPASTQVDALLELLPLRVGTLAVNWTMTKRGGPVPDPDTCREVRPPNPETLNPEPQPSNLNTHTL